MAKTKKPPQSLVLSRADAQRAMVRRDGWFNTLTGLGTGRDKRLSGGFSADYVDPDTAEALWESDDTAARIVEVVPDEMTREWIDITIEDDKDRERADALMSRLDELEAQSTVNRALCLARAIGGAGVVMGVDDSLSPEEPLNLEAVRGVNYLVAMDARELRPVAWYTDALDPRLGMPSLFELRPITNNNSAVATGEFPRVHESRVMKFYGVQTTRRKIRNSITPGWGVSIFGRIYQVLRDFNMTWAGVANLMQDFSQAQLKIKGLAELIAQNDDGVILKRAQMLDMSRSVARTVLLDSEEDFSRDTAAVGGVEGILDKFMLRLAAAARMPVSLLMGQAPSGLNATGDSDIRWFYDSIASQQRRVLKAPLNRLVLALMREEGMKEPENWQLTFRRLWQLTDAEQVTMRSQQASMDSSYISSGVLLPEEVAISRFGGDHYSIETKIDVELRRTMADQRAALEEKKVESQHAQEEQKKLNAEAPPAPPVPPVQTPAKPEKKDEAPRKPRKKKVTLKRDADGNVLGAEVEDVTPPKDEE